MKELIDMFLTFARIGGLTFGGGYAMLPMLQREVVEKHGWATEDELMNYYAVGQCTPGIIAVNTATFIGSKRRGIAGGIFATLGVVFPSLIIIVLIAACLTNFADIPAVKNAFAGIRVGVCVLIFSSVVKLFKKGVTDVPTGVIYALVLLGSVFLDLSPAVYVLFAGIAGLLIKVLSAKQAGREGGSGR